MTQAGHATLADIAALHADTGEAGQPGRHHACGGIFHGKDTLAVPAQPQADAGGFRVEPWMGFWLQLPKGSNLSGTQGCAGGDDGVVEVQRIPHPRVRKAETISGELFRSDHW